MIHPDMATMFGFLTTDALSERGWLQDTLREVTDRSFNMIDVDMDTSTSDMVVALANAPPAALRSAPATRLPRRWRAPSRRSPCGSRASWCATARVRAR